MGGEFHMLFDQVRKLSNVILKKIDKLEVDPNKCLKVRAVTSSCTACLDVCPADSIELKLDSIELKQSCLECGLCTAVCLTNALKWNHPPLIQLDEQISRLAETENEVYITCSTMLRENVTANVIEVPCLGMLPKELWISAGTNNPSLKIIYRKERCQSCKATTGQELFLKQLKGAESFLQHTFQIRSSLIEKKENTKVDHRRRRFLSSFLEEVKETNTITVKEVMEVNKTLSPFEKFDRYYQGQNEMEEFVEEVTEIKKTVVGKLISDSVTLTDKRTLLFNSFKKIPHIKEDMPVSMPNIGGNCNRCGACVFLCPTDAMIMDEDSIILSTSRCVSCGLCEEICYENHINLYLTDGTAFDEKFVYLVRN